MCRKQQNAPEAQSEIRYLDIKPLQNEIARFKRIAAEDNTFTEMFMTAPSPGIISRPCSTPITTATTRTSMRSRARCGTNIRRSTSRV